MSIKKRRKIDVSVEKHILIGMITSTKFIANFKHLYKPELFQMPFSKILSNWCWDYFNKYGKAPYTDIQDIFKENENKLEDSIYEAIDTVLVELSGDYENEKLNYKRLLDRAEHYMQSRNLENMLLQADHLLKSEKVKEAENLINGFAQIKRPESDGIDLFKNLKTIGKLIDSDQEDVIFRFKGAAGEIIPPTCRGEFISLVGPQKRGKSFGLQDIGKQALFSGFKVAHFNFEMPDKKLIKRYAQNFTGSPGRQADEGCLIPVFDCVANQRGCSRAKKLGINSKSLLRRDTDELPLFDQAPDEYKPCTACKKSKKLEFRMKYEPAIWYKKSNKPVISGQSVIKKVTQLKKYIRTGGIRWVTWPSESKSIDDVRNQLLLWEQEDGWSSDLIITDYADLMIPNKNVSEYRHKLDDIWKGHKRLAQEFHAAVVSATQATVETHEQRIKPNSVAEFKGKSGHVDRMIALNGDDHTHLIRWSLLFERHGELIEKDIVILQQLKIGNPHLDSYVEENYHKPEERKAKKRR